MIRREVQKLVELGPFINTTTEVLKERQYLLNAIKPPISNAEARQLAALFGQDDHFGLAWTMLHLIEGTPGWPLQECLVDVVNPWIVRLRDRVQNLDSNR